MGTTTWETPKEFADPAFDAPGTSESTAQPFDEEQYKKWMERGKKLATAYHSSHWKLGDWLLEGKKQFDVKEVVGEIPGYMLLHKTRDENGETAYESSKLPNFYRDVAAELGLAYQTVKNIAHVAGVYGPEERIPELTFSHHTVAAPYEDRTKYLKACLDVAEGEKPHSVDWLRQLIDEKENRPATKHTKSVQLDLPLGIWENLRLCAKFEDEDFEDIVKKVCLPAIKAYLEENQPTIEAMKSKRKNRKRR